MVLPHLVTFWRKLADMTCDARVGFVSGVLNAHSNGMQSDLTCGRSSRNPSLSTGAVPFGTGPRFFPIPVKVASYPAGALPVPFGRTQSRATSTKRTDNV